jgi:hypothetical protein
VVPARGVARARVGGGRQKTTTSEVVRPGAAFPIRPEPCIGFAPSKTCSSLEVSTPHLDDVVRLEDDYGRADAEGQPYICAKVVRVDG